MIQHIEKIEITQDTHPFAQAYTKCSFEENGYIEEEFFIHGLADVYGWKDGKKVTVLPENPYVNRILVRRPQIKERFSGNVVVEILNSTSFIDFDRCWALTWRHMMRNGDIYIGITSKPNVIPALLKFDYQRYKALSWKNPAENPQYTLAEKDLGNMEGASSIDTEDGLFWDMLTDLAVLLRNPENELLGNYAPYYQYLAGWSQSGAYMIRFVNDFAYERQLEQPYFDGYFSAGSASTCLPDLNQGYGRTAQKAPRRLKMVREPFMEVHTESENVLWGNTEARGKTCFSENMNYCIYDIPGATHDAKSTMTDYYRNDTDVFAAGIVPVYPGKEILPNDFPYETVFHTALHLLYEWVREGKQPFEAEPIQTDTELRNVTDETGNAVGGLRLPFVEVPLCIYHPVSTPMKPDYAFACTLFGYVELYTKERALKLYGSKEGYLNRFSACLGNCIRDGRILPEDEQICMNYAKRKAEEVFGQRK